VRLRAFQLVVASAVAAALISSPAGVSADPGDFRANKVAVLNDERHDAAARAAGPRLSEAQIADPDPALRLNLQPYTRVVFWRANCPTADCERQVPPLVDEGKTFATSNYYLGFDGSRAWSLYARWSLTDERGVLRLDRSIGSKQIQLPAEVGRPTLTEVTNSSAVFTTSTGREGAIDLATLRVTFIK
jgi:hypothetical protein